MYTMPAAASLDMLEPYARPRGSQMTKVQRMLAALAVGVGLTALSETGCPAGADMRLPDGTVEAGLSPETGKPIYTTQADAPGLYTFDQARAYCAGLNANGHGD